MILLLLLLLIIIIIQPYTAKARRWPLGDGGTALQASPASAAAAGSEVPGKAKR